MQTLYDLAGLAVVAYGEVASDGTSADLNSGVVTAKTGTGSYSITLPENKAQSGTRDILLVTPKRSPLNAVPVSAQVDDSDPAIKHVAIYGGSPLTTLADGAFSFVMFRSIVTPPYGSPA